MSGLDIRPVVLPDEVAEVRLLIREYVASLNVTLTFQNCEEELASLPGKYAPPAGCVLLATVYNRTAGCVASRPLQEGVCEMKRLYVRPEFRGHGLGRELSVAIIAEARRLGYQIMRLDTLESLQPALALYRSIGFKPIPAYYPNPLPGVVYLELELSNGKNAL